MDSSIERMVQYCSGIASEFEARLNRVRTFIPDHNLTSGTANEIILRDFLARFSTGQYRVGQGFICVPTASDLVSKQCDILVYDCHNYPLVHSEGEVVLIFPQAAKIVIEVKTRLNKKDLKDDAASQDMGTLAAALAQPQVSPSSSTLQNPRAPQN